MNIAAFDLSLTATGFAVNYPIVDGPFAGRSSGVITPGGLRGMKRLAYVRDLVLDISAGVDVVVLEGYAFGAARQSGLREIGELGGVVRLALDAAD